MNLLFKNVSKYSKEVYDEFLKFHSKNFSFRYNLFSLAISMLLIFFIMLHIRYNNYGITVIICACLTSFILYRYCYPIEEVRNEYNSEEIAKEISYTFSFYEKYFKIHAKREYYKIYYKDLYKIFETNKFFYLYLDKRHSFLLYKNGFQKGTSLEFKNFIKKKCPFRFRNVPNTI